MKEKKKLSLIVPCFNEQDALPFFYKEAKAILKQMCYDYIFIFIDDGSKDNTLQIIKDLAKKDPHVCYLSFSRNFGKEAAIYAGFCNMDGDYAAVMDADMQDPPSLLPKMMQILDDGEYDSVATRRAGRKASRQSGAGLHGNFIKLLTGFRMRILWMGQEISV